MPVRSVNAGFDEFHSRLTASTTETQAAKSHRESIESCLRSNFGLNRFFRSGSFGNGTNIRNYSDVDFFASMLRESLNDNSYTSLSNIATALRKKFPRTPNIKVDSPAVIVPFGEDATEKIEVIPADYMGTSEGHSVYEIPSSNKGWMDSSPEAQNSYVRMVNDGLSGKVKPLIRFLKAWKYYRQVPISSFYLELLTAKYADSENNIVYPIDVKNVFERMSNNGLSGVNDPTGVSGRVKPCKTDIQKDNALSKVKTALTRAENAISEDNKGNVAGAFEWWDKVYDGKFPARRY